MQRAIGHLGNVGIFHVLALYARQYFAVDLHLPVRAVVRGGVHAPKASEPDHHKQQHRKGRNQNRSFSFHGHQILLLGKESLPEELPPLYLVDAGFCLLAALVRPSNGSFGNVQVTQIIRTVQVRFRYHAR